MLVMARSPRSHASPIMRRVLVEIAVGMIVLGAVVVVVDRGRPCATVSVVAPHSHWFLQSEATPQPSADGPRVRPDGRTVPVRREDSA